MVEGGDGEDHGDRQRHSAILELSVTYYDLLHDFWQVINLSELQLIFNMKIVSSTHGALMTMK